MSLCRDCDVLLTAEEADFYITRCRRCEKLWSIRIDEWRHGRRDEPEFDRMYGAGLRLPTMGDQ